MGGYLEACGNVLSTWASPENWMGDDSAKSILEDFPRAIHWVAAPQIYIIQVYPSPQYLKGVIW